MKKAAAEVRPEAPAERIVISAPNFRSATFTIQGTTPYVQCRFAAKEEMMRTQAAGSQAKSKRKREPKDFARLYELAKHLTPDGWAGIPAGAFRAAMISACRLVGFKMTLAKLSVFVEADGFDQDGMALVRITKGTPRQVEHPVRLATGVMDIRARPMWSPGWEAKVRMGWDDDQFSMKDVTNLLARVGQQVGVGEGRNDSRESAGCGWGAFRVVSVS